MLSEFPMVELPDGSRFLAARVDVTSIRSRVATWRSSQSPTWLGALKEAVESAQSVQGFAAG